MGSMVVENSGERVVGFVRSIWPAGVALGVMEPRLQNLCSQEAR